MGRRVQPHRPDSTALSIADELFQLKHSAVIEHEAATREQEAVHIGGWPDPGCCALASGRVFPNFADPELEDWASAYYGPNYQRLVGSKPGTDPTLLPLPPIATSSLILQHRRNTGVPSSELGMARRPLIRWSSATAAWS